jgi:hypothetical protein
VIRRFLFGVLAVIAVVEFTANCGPRPFKPESPHPSPERIAELLAQPVPGRQAPAAVGRFEVKVQPPIVLAGGAAWVVCQVPASSNARRVRYGLEGVRMSEGPLERIEHRLLVERIPCGRWVATCALSTGERLEAALESIGGSCEDGG